MPELPEVEVIRRGLVRELAGKRFTAVKVGTLSLRRQSTREDLKTWTVGRRIQSLSRRGKYLLFHLEGGAILLVHLGMTGRLLISPASRKPQAHVHVTFRLENRLALHFQDVRRFGQILVYAPGQTPEPLALLGMEPLARSVTPRLLHTLTRGKRGPLKNFLIDGRVLAGIGNIYACEIMHAARLSPVMPVGCLSPSDCERLLRETRRILRQAIRRGGTTVSDFLNSRGETGLFRLDLQAYGREGAPCPGCGQPIARLTQAGRSTFFCPSCQRLRG